MRGLPVWFLALVFSLVRLSTGIARRFICDDIRLPLLIFIGGTSLFGGGGLLSQMECPDLFERLAGQYLAAPHHSPHVIRKGVAAVEYTAVVPDDDVA